MTEPATERSLSEPKIDPATQQPISTEPLISKKTRKVTTIVSIVVVLVVVAALVGLGYLMFMAYDWSADGVVPATVRLRDMAFIVIALETLIVMVLVLIIVVLLVILIVLTYDRVIPILEQLNRAINNVADTVHTVRGTTTFVSDKVVSPFIEVSGHAAGLMRILKGIADLWPRNKSSEPQQEPPAE